MTNAELWWNGPTCLAQASEQSDVEREVQRELCVVGVEGSNNLDTILNKFGLRKAMRVFGWVSRFIHNSRNPSEKINLALTTNKIAARETFWVKSAQQQASESEKFLEDKEQLNLQLNKEGIWECHRRIQGEYPVYLPDSMLFHV